MNLNGYGRSVDRGGQRLRFGAADLQGLWARIPLKAWMSILNDVFRQVEVCTHHPISCG